VSEGAASMPGPNGTDPLPGPAPGPDPSAEPLATDHARLWDEIRQRIKQQLGQQRYGIWFNKTVLVRNKGSTLVVGVPNVLTQQYLAHQYRETVAEAAAGLLGQPVEVRFVVEPGLFRQMRASTHPESEPGRTPSDAAGTEERGGHVRSTGLLHRFEDLVVTASNRLPFAAVREVAEGAEPRFRFLLLLGPPGSGKTALLEAALSAALDSGVARRAEHVSAESWCNDYYHAVQAGKTWQFRRRYRSCDMLLMDGVCFLQGKPAAQDELLYTVQSLTSAGGRVVLSSGAHPDDFQDVKASFRALFSGAFWVELALPQPAERVEMARAMARRHGLVASAEALRHVAEKHCRSLHELSGWQRSTAGACTS